MLWLQALLRCTLNCWVSAHYTENRSNTSYKMWKLCLNKIIYLFIVASQAAECEWVVSRSWAGVEWNTLITIAGDKHIHEDPHAEKHMPGRAAGGFRSTVMFQQALNVWHQSTKEPKNQNTSYLEDDYVRFDFKNRLQIFFLGVYFSDIFPWFFFYLNC